MKVKDLKAYLAYYRDDLEVLFAGEDATLHTIEACTATGPEEGDFSVEAHHRPDGHFYLEFIEEAEKDYNEKQGSTYTDAVILAAPGVKELWSPDPDAGL